MVAGSCRGSNVAGQAEGVKRVETFRIPAEKKPRIVLSVIAGETTVAEAARREKVSEQSIGRWKADFLAAGKTALTAGKSGPSSREEQLAAEAADLTQALGEAAVEIRMWKRSAQGRLGPSRTRGDPRRGGHVDHEVLRHIRHARADLAPRAGARPGG